MIRFARRVLCAAVLAAPVPLSAAPVDDYLAAHDQAVAAAVTAAKAGKSGDAAVAKAEQAALNDLGRRMRALVGPLKLRGLGAPAFSLDILVFGEAEPVRQLDGLAFSSKDEATRVLVTPEPVFQAWRAARAKDKDAPAAFGDGLKAAMATEYFANNSVINVGGGFWPYLALPVAAGNGETVQASLGVFTDEAPANQAPNSLVLVRVADGRASVGITRVTLEVKPIPACDAVWAPYAAKIGELQKGAEKDGKPDDPRWTEISRAFDDGSAAFRACFAQAAQSRPILAPAIRQAEGFLATLRAGGR